MGWMRAAAMMEVCLWIFRMSRMGAWVGAWVRVDCGRGVEVDVCEGLAQIGRGEAVAPPGGVGCG
jgi:hypothetical protein